MGCPCCRPVFSPVHVVNTPVLGTMFQFVRRTPSKSRDCARARRTVYANDLQSRQDNDLGLQRSNGGNGDDDDADVQGVVPMA